MVPRWLLVVVAVGLLWALMAGCGSSSLSQQSAIATPPAGETTLPFKASDVPASSLDDTGWLQVAPGTEWRQLLTTPPGADYAASVKILRLEQSAVQFRVGYAPDTPRLISQWCADDNMLAAINGGFFFEDYHSTALVISDGVAWGTSYQEQGGMFAVDAWGNVSLRYLAATPYDPNEVLQQAMHAWPMLIAPGGTVVYTQPDDGERARRSVIAMDRSGRVLLLAFSGSDFTLRGLTDWLAASDLDLDSALNLDGGSSTAMCVQTATFEESVSAFGTLPMVLQVFPR